MTSKCGLVGKGLCGDWHVCVEMPVELTTGDLQSGRARQALERETQELRGPGRCLVHVVGSSVRQMLDGVAFIGLLVDSSG